MKALAITLIEVGNSEAPNIGTIVSETGDNIELTGKAMKAIESHFDAEIVCIKIQDSLELSDVRNSCPLDAEVEINMDGSVHRYQIEIQQTWIY